MAQKPAGARRVSWLVVYSFLLLGAVGVLVMRGSNQLLEQMPGGRKGSGDGRSALGSASQMQTAAGDEASRMLGRIQGIFAQQKVLRQQYESQKTEQQQQQQQQAIATNKQRPGRPPVHPHGQAPHHPSARSVHVGPKQRPQPRQVHLPQPGTRLPQDLTIQVPAGPSKANCDGAASELVSMHESNGFFCDSDEAWNLKKEIARLQQPHQRRTSPFGMNAFYQENWEPNFSCEFERRLGQPGDGGKWVCDPHKLQQQEDCLVYSFGSNNAFDFEEAIHQSIGPHCEIHTFDHTIGNNPSKRPKYVTFHPWGIGTARSGVLRSLDQIVKDLNHAGREIHILKMDVEGAEFKALPQLLNAGVFGRLGIRQVLIEVHRAPPETVHSLMQAFFNAGFAIFHKEANIQYPMGPQDVCVEFAFIRLERTFLHEGFTRPRLKSAPANCANGAADLASARDSSEFLCEDDDAWRVKKDIARLQQPHQKRTSPRGMRALYQENWEPNFSCGYERRIGHPGDGGKWVCDAHKLRWQKDCLVYSFGSNNAFDFEEAIHKNTGGHCEIHTFDHTIGNNPSRKPDYVKFHPWGLGPANKGGLKSLESIAQELHHIGRAVHIFKIDVEGAEFNTLPKLLNDGFFDKLQVQQILIEVHRNEPATVHALMEAFHRAGYAIFHKEPNIQYPMSAIDVCVEYALIKLGPEFWDWT